MSNQSLENQTAQGTTKLPEKNNDWQLIALSPELGDLSIPVGTSLRIGRQDTNDVVLASPSISRQHAKLNRIGEKLYVQDLGSANGTFVNGERMTSEAYRLQGGDELAFADIAFVVTQDADIDADAILENIVNELSSSNNSLSTGPATSDRLETAVTDTLANDTVITKAPVEPIAAADINTLQDSPVISSTTSDIIEGTSATTSVYTITDSADVTEAKVDVKPVSNNTITQPVSDIAAKTTSMAPTPTPTVAHTPVQAAVNSPVTEAVTQPITTSAPVSKTETNKMAMIAIMLVVLIALGIIASIFL